MTNVCEYLSSKKYPGRGIYIAKSIDGTSFWCAYWIMGRSENSRNRVFEDIKDCDIQGVMTRAADDAKVSDPHLIIYNPLLVHQTTKSVIITNGDQTNTIYDHMCSTTSVEHSFFDALCEREYEDDEPNWTPRISALINRENNSFMLSILKKEKLQKTHCVRAFYHYDKMCKMRGRLITTYVDDGDPLPTFSGDPILLEHDAHDLSDFREKIWNSLNDENKISLLCAEIGKEINWEIVNKYERVN